MSTVHIDIDARIDEKSLRESELKARKVMLEAGQQAGRNFGQMFAVGFESQADRIQRAAGKSETATNRLTKAELDYVRATQSGDIEKQIGAMNRLAKVRNDLANQGPRLEQAFKSMRGIGDDARKSERDVHKLAQSMRDLQTVAGGVGGAARGFGMAALAPVAVAATGAIAGASGALALLPGAAMAAGSAFGVLRAATAGFGDAVKDAGDPKKFAEDIQSLSPAAQQAALELQHLTQGPLKDLQQAAQESLFQGVAQDLDQLTTQYLPALKNMTTGVSSAFNSMFHGLVNELARPDTAAALNATMTNIVGAFQNLAPAVGPFTRAIADLVATGSGFLPGLAASAANAAREFGAFIAQARESGQLKQWISDGLDTLRQLGGLAIAAGQAFGALIPAAREILPSVTSALTTIADTLKAHPSLIFGVVGAFAAWKTIEGVASLANAIKGVGLAISGLSGLAQAAAGGISAALASVAVPAWLATLTKWAGPLGVGAQADVKNAADLGLNIDDYSRSRGGGSFAPQDGVSQRQRDDITSRPHDWNTMPSAPAWNQYAVPPPPGSSGSKANQGPIVPYPTTDPMSLVPKGLPINNSLYSAAQGIIEAQYKIAQDQATIDALRKSNTATESEIQAAQNDLVKDGQKLVQAKLRMNEAEKSARDSQFKDAQQATKAYSQLESGLDKDFGISKGLAGMADNLVRFVGKLATAPLMAQLEQITGGKSASETGSGLIGMAGASGAFGPDFVPQSQQDQQSYAAQQIPYVAGNMPGADVTAAAKLVGTQYSQALRNDCSGMVGQVINDALGTAGSELPTTKNMQSWLAQRGFVPGIGGPGDISVGWYDRGPNPNDGHAAMTLSDGRNFEAGGSSGSATLGGSVGASNPMFDQHMFRPGNGASLSGGPMASSGNVIPVSVTNWPGGGPIGSPVATPTMANTSSPVPSPTASNTPTATPWTPSASAGYAPLTPDQLTNPGLTPTPIGGGPGTGALPGPGGPPQGMPPNFPGSGVGGGAMPGAQFSPGPAQYQDYQRGQGGWQPKGGGAGIGGLLQGAISSAIGAAGAAGAGGGGQAAAALGQMAMQAINRTISFGGSVAGDLVGGLFETFGVGGSPLADPMQGWLGRVVGGLAQAAPALASTAGDRGKPVDQKNDQPQGPGTSQQGQQVVNTGQQGGIGTVNMTVQNGQTGQQVANNLAWASSQNGNGRTP